MREIIFRAKRGDNGEWVEGYFIRTLIGVKEVSVIVPKGAFDGMRISDKIYQVYANTVEQFTGFLDAGGDKIFEGDILENAFGFEETDERKIRGMVVFHEGAFCLIDLKTINYVDFGVYPFEPYFPEFLEVVGNRFDNPELLEVNK